MSRDSRLLAGLRALGALIVLSGALLVASGDAYALTTYKYTGPSFTSFDGGTTFETHKVTGLLTLTFDPAPNSFLTVNATIAGSNIAAFSFSAGPLTIDETSALDILSFFIIFGPSGNVVPTNWTISLVNTTTMPASQIKTGVSSGDSAELEVGSGTDKGSAAPAGTWMIAPIMLPEPGSALLLGLALAGLLATARRA